MTPLAGPAARPTLGELDRGFLHAGARSFGGVLPWARRMLVEERRWLTAAEFTDLFGLCNFLPGPCLPSCTLTYLVARVWQRFRGARWRGAVEAGLAPITIGLVLATGWLVARGAQTGWPAYAVTAASAILVLATRVNPVWLLGAAGVLGLLGLV